jgi:hypothetical protein
MTDHRQRALAVRRRWRLTAIIDDSVEALGLPSP